MIVNDPSGNWHCNDDFDSAGGTNPGVVFSQPDAGIYDIWVGTYSEGEAFESANLHITELGAPWDSNDSSASTNIDPMLDANYGNIDLAGLFEPDPYQLTISAGGTMDASTIENCAGYVSSAPDLQLDFSNPSD